MLVLLCDGFGGSVVDVLLVVGFFLAGWILVFVLFLRHSLLKPRLTKGDCGLLILLPLPSSTVITRVCQPPCPADFLFL